MTAHPFLPRLDRPLILASRSPRRRQLLEMQAMTFLVRPADIEESVLAGESPRAHAERLAREKAHAVAATDPEKLVLGSDTIVVVEREVLGKPADQDEARAMLQRLAGGWHEVISAIALCCAQCGFDRVVSESTRVRFRDLSPGEIAAYVQSGEPLDKAGSYGIQGLGALLVEGIEGCYFNVMGLPLQRLRQVLWEFHRSDRRPC